MKLSVLRLRRFRVHGFTLVELLVVIAIIAILASVILYAGTTAINAAKRVKASNMANQIQTATLAYYTEYSVYPTLASATGTATDYVLTDTDGGAGYGSPSSDWGPLTECLCGLIKPSTGAAATETAFTNTRQISFLSLKSTDVQVSGASQDAPTNPLPPDGSHLFFNIAVDTDYDGVLGANDPGATSTGWLPQFSPASTSGTFTPPYGGSGGGSSTAGVAVWADCVGSTTKFNSNQWVKTY